VRYVCGVVVVHAPLFCVLGPAQVEFDNNDVQLIQELVTMDGRPSPLGHTVLEKEADDRSLCGKPPHSVVVILRGGSLGATRAVAGLPRG
jgi:hypothetical protein